MKGGRVSGEGDIVIVLVCAGRVRMDHQSEMEISSCEDEDCRVSLLGVAWWSGERDIKRSSMPEVVVISCNLQLRPGAGAACHLLTSFLLR